MELRETNGVEDDFKKEVREGVRLRGAGCLRFRLGRGGFGIQNPRP